MKFTQKTFRTAFLIFNLIALPAIFILGQKIITMKIKASQTPLPVYGTLRPFGLIDQKGQPFGLSAMRGRLWVANFMFTSCPNQCPAMNFKMSLLQDRLPVGSGLISFSVDPEKDTVQVLERYSHQFKAREGVWYFLTGPKAAIAQLLEDCHFAKADDPLLHGLRLVLLDGSGNIRGYYDYSDDKNIKKLTRDFEVLKEKG